MAVETRGIQLAGLVSVLVLGFVAPAIGQDRGFLLVNGGFLAPASGTLRDVATPRQNAEDGSLSTTYVVDGGVAFDVAGGARIWRQLGVGVGVTRFSQTSATSVSAEIPHPFFFGRNRAVSGAATGLKREELAVHLQIRGTVPAGERFQFSVFGGPSFFQVKQGVVTGVQITETYPYDVAAFASAQTIGASESVVGFNAGADIAFFFVRQVGVGFTAQFSRGNVKLPAAEGGTIEATVGGTQVGAGLRLRF